jgi:hypothetical protein
MIVATGDTRGLLRAALGEALGGFAANSFPRGERPTAAAYLQRVEEEAISLTNDDLVFLIKVVQFALKELGPEEFQTITGYDFDFGVATVEAFQQESNATKGKMEY